MLVWSRSGRAGVWAVGALVLAVFYGAPILVIGFASIAGHWNGVLPSDFTLRHFVDAVQGESGGQLRASIVTGLVASGLSLVIGTWAALALRDVKPAARRVLDLLFFMPSAVPSVSVGLGLLVAFSRPPVLLNGTTEIVFVAHLILVSAFTYGSVTAGLVRIAPEYEQVAASLGARPAYRLRRVTLSVSARRSSSPCSAAALIFPPSHARRF